MRYDRIGLRLTLFIYYPALRKLFLSIFGIYHYSNHVYNILRKYKKLKIY